MRLRPNAIIRGARANCCGAARENPAQTTGMVPTGVPNVFMKSGVVLTDSMKKFLMALQPRLGFVIGVTSGLRTPLSQAQALAQDYAFGVYGAGNALVAEIKAGGLGVNEMAATIQRQVDSGRFLSRHMRGDALDFTIRGITGSERQQLIDAGRELGAEVLDEGDHIHMEHISGDFEIPTVGYIPVVVASVSSVGLLGAMWWFRDPLRAAIRRRFK